MEKKECLCDAGKASHDEFFRAFLKDVESDDKEAADKIISWIKEVIHEYDVDSGDLENLMFFLINRHEHLDQATVEMLLCFVSRSEWVTSNVTDDPEYGTFEDFQLQEECRRHLICMVHKDHDLWSEFIEDVTDDSC